MIPDIDIYRAAKLLVDQHGEIVSRWPAFSWSSSRHIHGNGQRTWRARPGHHL
jgi:hypothetical protein